MKVEEEKLKPTFNNLNARMIDHTLWPEVGKNWKNLEDVGLWDFLLIPLEPQDNVRTRQFLYNSVWGSKSIVDIERKIVHFSLASISETFKLPQGKATVLTKAIALSSAMLRMVFDDKKAKTKNGFMINKAKGIWKAWLPWVNERILMAEVGVGTILEEGLALAVMAWQGVQLSWGNILYEQMKLEFMKKHGKNAITLYSIPYITYLTSSFRKSGTLQPILSTINSSTVVQPISTLENPPPQAHLIQIRHRSNIPRPFWPKKRKKTLPVIEEEAPVEDEVEVLPYKFNSILVELLQRDTYWRTYVNVAPEETLCQFKHATVVEDIGARLQASAIREREARSMILEGLKREAQHK